MRTIAFFFKRTFLLFVHPVKTLAAVDTDKRRIRLGLFGSLFLTLVYVIVLVTAHFLRPGSMPAEQSLVLRIPAAQYYLYELFMLLPAALAGAVLAAGAVRLLGSAWRGAGSFERLFSLLSFSYVIVALVMGLPDLISDFWPQAPFFQVHVFLGSAWYFVLSLLAVKRVEALSWPKTIVLTLAASAANGVVQFICIR